MKRFLIILLIVSLVIAVFVSWFASPLPDGLERVAENLGFIDKASDSSYKIFPDYTVHGLSAFWSNGLAGIIGTLATFCIVIILGRFISRKRRQGGRSASHLY